MAEVTELITKFSFEGSTKPLIDYNSGLGESVKLLGAMGAASGAATFAVAKWASGVSQSLQPLFDLSEQTGVAVASLQELSFAAEQSGSSSQALESSISGLSAKIGEAAQKGSEEFTRLGISVRDNVTGEVKKADELLIEVGKRFKEKNLSIPEQQGFAEALGIDPSLISMLSQTSAEIEKLKQRARDLGITLSPEDKKSLKEYNRSIAEMDSAMSGLKKLIAVAIVPELEGLAEGFSDLLAKNNEWIVDGVEATVEFVVDLVDALKRLAPFILATGAAFAIATIGTSGFAAALGFVLSPAVLIAAGILAIAIVLDDLIVAFRGGDSVIANFFANFGDGWDIQPLLKDIVAVFKEVVGGILGGAKIIFDALEPIAPLIAVVGAAFVAATVGPKIFAGALALVTSPITLIIAGVAGILWAVNDLTKAFQGGESVIADFFQAFLGFVQPVLDGIVEGSKAAFATVTNLVSGLFGGMVKIFSGIGDILSGNFSEGFEKIGEGFMENIDTWVEAFRSVFGEAFNWLKQKALDILPDWAVKLIGGAGDAASGAADIAGDVGSWVGGLFGGEDMIPKSQAMQPGGAVTNVGGTSSRVEQTVNMEIKTLDPERAGKAASDGLQRQLEDTRTQTRGRGGS